MLVLRYNVSRPAMTTDCKSILDAATGGSAKVTAADRPLARIWTMIGSVLDDDINVSIRDRTLEWMPAH